MKVYPERVEIRRVLYFKERFSLGLHIKRSRLTRNGRGRRGLCGYYLKNPDRVVASMVRAIRRYWRDAPYNVVDTKAHDYMICNDHTDNPYVVITIETFRNINPIHRDELQTALSLPDGSYEAWEIRS